MSMNMFTKLYVEHTDVNPIERLTSKENQNCSEKPSIKSSNINITPIKDKV